VYVIALIRTAMQGRRTGELDAGTVSVAAASKIHELETEVGNSLFHNYLLPNTKVQPYP
jgi:hypothetical protein